MRILVFGTFDLLHKGHVSFLRQAKNIARKNKGKLIVVVARDINVKKIKKKKPFENEMTRMEKVKRLNLADDVILGSIDNRVKIIEKIKPDIICLGYDQKTPKGFKHKIQELGIQVIRLKPYKKNKFKTSKIAHGVAL